MTKIKQKIGIFGGTFDPPHLGHLAAGCAALVLADLDEVRFVVAGKPWQKTIFSDIHHRVEMTHRLVAGIQGLVVDDSELSREGPSYTVDTLESYASEDVDLFLIVGADAYAAIDTWKDPARIRELAKIVVLPRHGIAAADNDDHATVLQTALVDISATEVRRLVQNDVDVSNLTSKRVSQYIAEFGLYRC